MTRELAGTQGTHNYNLELYVLLITIENQIFLLSYLSSNVNFLCVHVAYLKVRGLPGIVTTILLFVFS